MMNSEWTRKRPRSYDDSNRVGIGAQHQQYPQMGGSVEGGGGGGGGGYGNPAATAGEGSRPQRYDSTNQQSYHHQGRQEQQPQQQQQQSNYSYGHNHPRGGRGGAPQAPVGDDGWGDSANAGRSTSSNDRSQHATLPSSVTPVNNTNGGGVPSRGGAEAATHHPSLVLQCPFNPQHKVPADAFAPHVAQCSSSHSMSLAQLPSASLGPAASRQAKNTTGTCPPAIVGVTPEAKAGVIAHQPPPQPPRQVPLLQEQPERTRHSAPGGVSAPTGVEHTVTGTRSPNLRPTSYAPNAAAASTGTGNRGDEYPPGKVMQFKYSNMVSEPPSLAGLKTLLLPHSEGVVVRLVRGHSCFFANFPSEEEAMAAFQALTALAHRSQRSGGFFLEGVFIRFRWGRERGPPLPQQGQGVTPAGMSVQPSGLSSVGQDGTRGQHGFPAPAARDAQGPGQGASSVGGERFVPVNNFTMDNSGSVGYGHPTAGTSPSGTRTADYRASQTRVAGVPVADPAYSPEGGAPAVSNKTEAVPPSMTGAATVAPTGTSSTRGSTGGRRRYEAPSVPATAKPLCSSSSATATSPIIVLTDIQGATQEAVFLRLLPHVPVNITIVNGGSELEAVFVEFPNPSTAGECAQWLRGKTLGGKALTVQTL